MGIRFTFYAVQRSALEELADASLAQIARRVGWPVHTEATRGPRGLQLGPARIWTTEDGPGLDWPFRVVFREDCWSALRILQALAVDGVWPTLRLVQRGYRRWWIAGLVHALRPFEREWCDDGLDALARMVQPCPVQVPWFDARVRALAEGAPLTLPVLRAPSRQQDRTCAEVEPDALATLLDWADTVPRLPDPFDRPGDDTDWDALVRLHLRVLRAAAPGELLLTELL